MPTGKQTLDHHYLEMRARCLALAADLDRIARAEGGSDILQTDPRIQKLRQGMQILLDEHPRHAERVQLLFSDQSPLPKR